MTANSQARRHNVEASNSPVTSEKHSFESCQGEEESVALQLVDKGFRQHVTALQGGAQGRGAFPAEDWGEAETLRDAFLATGQHVTDLTILGGISEKELFGLNGKVCRYRGLVQQPLNTEFYAGAVPCPRSSKKSPDQVVWHTSKYRDKLQCCSALDTVGENGFLGSDSVDSSEVYSLSATADFPSSSCNSDENKNGQRCVLPVQIWNRWPYQCVPVPGETKWCRHLACQRTQSVTGDAGSSTATETEQADGSPIPAALNECTLLLYSVDREAAASGECSDGDNAEGDDGVQKTSGKPQLLLNDIVDAVGILSVLPTCEESAVADTLAGVSSGSSLKYCVKHEMEQETQSRCLCTSTEGTPTQRVASRGVKVRLHVFNWKRVCFFNPAVDRALFHFSLSSSVLESPEATTVTPRKRDSLIRFLSKGLGGDLLAAEYLLLALCCRRMSSTSSAEDEGGPFSRLNLNFVTRPLSQQNATQQLQLVKQETTAEKGGHGDACKECHCSFSVQSQMMMEVLDNLVPRLVGLSVRPSSLATSSLTPKLLLDDDSADNLGRLARGVLQLARGTVLVIDEPEVVSKRVINDACRRIVEADSKCEEREAPISCVKRECADPSVQPNSKAGSTEARQDNGQKERKELQAKKLEELNQKAAQNLRALEALVADGEVSYDFIVSRQRVATDTINICMTTSTASSSVFAPHLLPVPVEGTTSNGVGFQHTKEDCERDRPDSTVTDVRDDATEETAVHTDVAVELRQEREIRHWRTLIGAASRRELGVDIPDETRQMMIEDWVRVRQEDRSVKSDDFPVWLVLADAMAASFGEGCFPLRHDLHSGSAIAERGKDVGKLSPEHWHRVMDLETRRRARLAVQKKAEYNSGVECM
ncbi:putative alanine racemase [Toxoplasma gondii TgCatPRC2]|uniref:Putative alanine racemase n=1 Tax=Toxoplasma gondii TgCatPRC2 TaxID=1130821 RepID=A0A151HQE9_TOXGO|nr:putative alanine racemase [Toxoplasma gondii TgCatPRC2]